MPYSNASEVPKYVPESKRRQWMHVWNSAYQRAKDKGQSDKEAEEFAFREANGVADKIGGDLEVLKACLRNPEGWKIG